MDDVIEQNQENQETIGTRNNDRLALFEQISDSAEEVRKEEFDDENQEFSQQNVEETDVTRQYAPLPKLKVNGQEMEITPEIIERAQKVASADVYLAEAARVKREAEMNARRPSEEDVSDHVEADDIALVRALQMGTEEEAVEAIRRLRTPSLNRDEVMQAARVQIEMDQAVKKFQSEYPEIWEDPMLKKLAFDRDNELLQASPGMSYSERYDTIGKEITNWVGKYKPNMADKKQRKETAAGNTVQTQSRRAEQAQEEEVEETAQDIISAMARKRGQIQ